MRLIDSDALLENQPKGCYRTSDWINNAPTIDAIPVEWVFEQMQILHELHNKNEYALQWLMELWQKEQEAR